MNISILGSFLSSQALLELNTEKLKSSHIAKVALNTFQVVSSLACALKLHNINMSIQHLKFPYLLAIPFISYVGPPVLFATILMTARVASWLLYLTAQRSIMGLGYGCCGIALTGIQILKQIREETSEDMFSHETEQLISKILKATCAIEFTVFALRAVF